VSADEARGTGDQGRTAGEAQDARSTGAGGTDQGSTNGWRRA
jgi:hypothetical protein